MVIAVRSIHANLRFSEAMLDFETTLKNLRGNLLIDYKQLGLQYKLYSCEVSISLQLHLSVVFVKLFGIGVKVTTSDTQQL